jgi:hypothetical protein
MFYGLYVRKTRPLGGNILNLKEMELKSMEIM